VVARVRGGHPLCVDLKRRLSATTSLDLNRTLSLARITRISFKKNSHNLMWKPARRPWTDWSSGQQFFSCCLGISEGLNNYASQLDVAEIHFICSICATNPRHGPRAPYSPLFPVCRGPTHHLRYLARLVNPGFLGEPLVIGPADRAVGAREEHHTASKAFAIRFDAGRDRASRLRAFDHEYTHLQPPWFSFAFSFTAGR
jgi:hypothetical protein